MILFANETVAETAHSVEATGGVFPPYFGVMLLALAVVFAVVMVLFLVGYRLIDFITPGNLSQQLLGSTDPKVVPSRPNVALAMVVAAMVIGMSIVLGLTVHGVLTH